MANDILFIDRLLAAFLADFQRLISASILVHPRLSFGLFKADVNCQYLIRYGGVAAARGCPFRYPPTRAIYNARIGAENMTTQVKLVFVLTFVIHLISMLSYAGRIAGVRTRSLAGAPAMVH